MVSVLSTQASRCTNLHRTANKIKQGSKSSHTLVSTASLYLFFNKPLPLTPSPTGEGGIDYLCLLRF